MPDREKVIKGLEVVRNAIVDGYIHEPDRAVNAITDALALLEERDAVEPYIAGSGESIAGSGESFETAETWWYECGSCNKPIDPNDKFCRHCGHEVKWE